MRPIVRALLAAAALLPLACSAADAPAAYTEGKEYKLVRNPTPHPGGKHVVVEEFFWYGCPHCYAFEPVLGKWVDDKPSDVDFVRVPNSLGRPVGNLHSKTYYTAEELKLLPKLHLPVFQAIHDEHRELATEADIQAFFSEKTGIMPEVFSSTFNGKAVDAKVRRSEELAVQYGVASTPTLVVDGRYMLNASMAGGFPQLLKVLDFVVDKARAERKKK